MGLRELMRTEIGPTAEPERVNSLEYLQRIYRDPTLPASVRMRAAIESLPYESPKLSATTIASISGNDFAKLLDRAIARSLSGPPMKLIEAQVEEEG